MINSLERAPPTAAAFEQQITQTGFAQFRSVMATDQIAKLKADAVKVQALRRRVQEKNGVAVGMDGIAHHVLGEGTSLDAFINAPPLWDAITRIFDGKFILLNFGATLHPPGGLAYTMKPHRDVRAFTPDYCLSLNMLVMLDDFTVENGATLVLPGSHRVAEPPTLEDFQAGAKPLLGKAGDIVLFNSLLVHAGGANTTGRERVALTLCFGRPFMKPQMDWPRYLNAASEAGLSDRGRQLLGYHARVAASLDEYYQPQEYWTFKADQR